MAETSSFKIYLDPEADGGNFRYQNAPGEVQRQHLVDRGDTLMVLADLVDVIHGRLSPQGDHATLVITDFQFIPSKNSRRFTSATITFLFESSNPASCEIEVIDIAPQGHHSMLPTTTQVELTRSANLSGQGGATGASIAAGLGWELKESKQEKDETTLTGSIRLQGREFGGKNTARWTLSENRSQKSGIPTLLRTAILLKRQDKGGGPNERFRAGVDIKSNVDLVSSIGESIDKVLGRLPRDDPVIFDPLREPSSLSFDPDNLRAHELNKLFKVLTTTRLSNTVQGNVARNLGV